MEHLTKLLRDSYDLQESKPDESAYWHLQQLRSEIKQLTIPVVVGQTLPIDSVIESVEFNADEIIAFLNDCETLDEAKMFADEHLR